MATAPSPNDLTRQQLDELDALLQRMLSVPLAPPDTPLPVALSRADAPLPPSWRADPPAPVAAPSMPHLLLVEPPAPKAEPPEPPKPVAEVPKPSTVPAKPKASETPKVESPKPQAAAPPKPQTVITPVPSAPPVPLPLMPLVAVNAAFDAVCGLFGPPGHLLRSAFFKHIYGLAGLGLIAYTAAHVAQTQGWITLPVTVPWPPRTWPQ